MKHGHGLLKALHKHNATNTQTLQRVRGSKHTGNGTGALVVVQDSKVGQLSLFAVRLCFVSIFEMTWLATCS